MKTERDEEGKVTKTYYDRCEDGNYDGEVKNMKYKYVYDDGRIEECKATNTGHYIIKYRTNTNRLRIPVFCPKCTKLMDGFDTKAFLAVGTCAKCDSINPIPFYNLKNEEQKS